MPGRPGMAWKASRTASMRPEMARRWNMSPSHRSRGFPSTPFNRAPLSHVPQTVGLSLDASVCSRFQTG